MVFPGPCLKHGYGCYQLGDIAGYFMMLAEAMMEKHDWRWPTEDPVAQRFVVMCLSVYPTFIMFLEMLEDSEEAISELFVRNVELQTVNKLKVGKMN